MRPNFYSLSMLSLTFLLMAICPIFATAQSTYTAPNCEFLVNFPEPPAIKFLYASGIGEYQSAEYFSSESFLRAECVTLTATSSSKSEAIRVGEAYASSNGLQNYTIEYSESGLGKAVTVRGYKVIESENLIFSVIIVYGNRSIMSLYAGGLAATYPQRNVSLFFDSLRKGNTVK